MIEFMVVAMRINKQQDPGPGSETPFDDLCVETKRQDADGPIDEGF